MTDLVREWTAEKQVEENIKKSPSGDGEYVIRTIHRLKLTKELIDICMWFVEDMDYGDDWECDIGNGMYCDQDGDIRWIDVNKFVEAIKLKLDEDGLDFWEEDELKERYTELEQIKKYAGYTINCNFED